MILLHCLQATHETTWNVTHQLHDTSVHLSKTQQVRVLSFFFCQLLPSFTEFFFLFSVWPAAEETEQPDGAGDAQRGRLHRRRLRAAGAAPPLDGLGPIRTRRHDVSVARRALAPPPRDVTGS